jgi:hypothetical protein
MGNSNGLQDRDEIAGQIFIIALLQQYVSIPKGPRLQRNGTDLSTSRGARRQCINCPYWARCVSRPQFNGTLIDDYRLSVIRGVDQWSMTTPNVLCGRIDIKSCNQLLKLPGWDI